MFPVISSLVLTHIESALSPSENPPKIVLAVLRLLVHLAESSPYTSPGAESFQESAVPDVLYSKSIIQVFGRILGQSSQSAAAQEQISLVCTFISQTCKSDQQQAILAAEGLLSLLSARLASYHVHQQRGWPARPNAALVPGFLPPPTRQTISSILAAIEAIIVGSNYRVARFISSPLLNIVFPQHKPEAFHDRALAQRGGALSSAFVSPLEFSLPQIPPLYVKESSAFGKTFPSLGSVPTSKTENISFEFLQAANTSATASLGIDGKPGDESSFVSWLIQFFRSETGIARLRACKLLACLRRAGLTSRSRDRMLALLVVPVLVAMLDDAMKMISPAHLHVSHLTTDTIHNYQKIKEEVPFILASFIAGNQLLQKAASESNVISRACQLLKHSYDPINLPPSGWSMTGDSTADTAMVDELSATRRLGAPGLPAGLVHALRCREGALKLFAALADRDDRYRKQLLADPAIGACLTDSLVPFDTVAFASLNPQKSEKLLPKTLGNTVPVLLAACEALRMFARSVTLLRTNLLDAGMAEPLIALLNNSNVDVVRQATDACVNIANDFCPMRDVSCKSEETQAQQTNTVQELVKTDIMQVLCDHAHSADTRIRLVSLLALKNLCNKAPQSDKLRCFSLLTSPWLMQVIKGVSPLPNDSNRSFRPTSSLSMGGNAAGERVDILNAMEADPMDVIDDRPIDPTASSSSLSAEEYILPESISEIIYPAPALKSIYNSRLTMLEGFAKALSASEAYAEELKMQTAGLDFLRNLILDDDNHILDVVFNEISASTLFDLLHSKLKTPSPTSSSSSMAYTGAIPLGPSARAPSPHPTCTIVESGAVRSLTTSVLFVLVHIAAGASVHRQMLIAQRPILLAMFPLLSHSDPEIRRCVVWVIINLTYTDDKDEAVNTRARAQELRAMGWEERLKEVREQDDSVDVRERAATAVEQLRGIPSSGSGGGNGYVGGERGHGVGYGHGRSGSTGSMSFSSSMMHSSAR